MERNETKHTPGPWKLIGCAVAVPGTDVARVYMPRGMSEEECRANGRLIAAAPTLLEALQGLMEYAGIIEERCDAVATQAARDAIALATSANLKEPQSP